MKIKKCLTCDKEVRRKGQKYCSYKCLGFSHRNGKLIPCSNCKEPVYSSISRQRNIRFCSFKCLKEGKQGFKPKEKSCIICNKTFIITEPLRNQDKMCSYECRKEKLKRNSVLQTAKNKKLILQKKCENCGKSFETSKYLNSKNCSKDCKKQILSKTRFGENNPAYRGGFSKKGKNIYDSKHLAACAKYKVAFLKKNEFLFCEVCGVNKNGTLKFETHHIYYASRFPKHPELHNPKNLILICIKCHNDFHAGVKEEEFKKIEKERGLKKLFKIK